MFLPILQHVEECGAHLCGRSELAGVIAVVPDWTFPREPAVHRKRDADCEAANSLHQCAASVGFDDGVQVIRLYRKCQHPEEAIRGCANRRQDRVKSALAS